jgi:hypothetical protein
MGEEGFYLGRAHLCRMTLGVEENEASDPFRVRLFGADAVVLGADAVAYLVEQARLWQHHRSLPE